MYSDVRFYYDMGFYHFVRGCRNCFSILGSKDVRGSKVVSEGKNKFNYVLLMILVRVM